MKPVTQYARSGDVSVAFQVAGEGPVDLVLVPGAFSHLEFAATNPDLVAFAERLASFSRLITLDKRGTGMSDRDVAVYSLEERMDDLRAVMDAADSERAVIMGTSEGGPLSILFAATYPERTAGLILFGTFPRIIDGDGWRGVERESWDALIEESVRLFGQGPPLEVWAPSVAGQPGLQEWWAAYHRAAASPGAVRVHMRMQAEIDVRSVLPAIQCPTLVLHRRGDMVVPIKTGRYLASRIPGARFVELPGDDHLPYGPMDELFGAVEEFLTGSRSSPTPTRVLGTIVFTDLVDSTSQAVAQGDFNLNGATSLIATTTWHSVGQWPTAGGWSNRPATGYSPSSTAPPGLCDSRPRLAVTSSRPG